MLPGPPWEEDVSSESSNSRAREEKVRDHVVRLRTEDAHCEALDVGAVGTGSDGVGRPHHTGVRCGLVEQR